MEHYEHYEICENFKPRNEEKERIEEDKELLEKKFKELNDKWSELYRKVDSLRNEIYDINREFGKLIKFYRKICNEEKLGGNIHKDCEYYNADNDTCYNYIMTSKGFEVSRFDKCVDDL